MLLLRRHILLLLRRRRREALALLLLLLLLLLRLEAAQMGRGAEHQRQDGQRYEGQKGVEALHWREAKAALLWLGSLGTCALWVGGGLERGGVGEVNLWSGEATGRQGQGKKEKEMP